MPDFISLPKFKKCFGKVCQSSSFECVVSGSKPNPIFPSNSTNVFIGAHGGIGHAGHFLDDTRKFGAISNITLTRDLDNIKMWNSISGTRLDTLFIFRSIPYRNVTLDPLDYLDVRDNVVMVSRTERTLLEFRALGLPFVLESIFHRKPHKIAGAILQIIREHTFWRCRLSMGMLGAALGTDLFPDLNKLVIAGIGFQSSGSSYFYDLNGPEQGVGHIRQDIFFVNKLVSKTVGLSVTITDEDAKNQLTQYSRIGHVS